MSDGCSINVTRSSMPPFEEYCDEIRNLWDNHMLTNCGFKHECLRVELSKYLKVECTDLFVNGHNALECAFEAFELGADGRDEVITTPFTFASTTNAIVRKGLRPVFCDIRADDYTINSELIEGLITTRTCAIVPVHVYGNPCDVNAIEDIAKRNDLRVIYDSAHAFGVELDGRGIGSFGDASMFSFHATKVFNSIEGGAITHSSPELSKRLASVRNFGFEDGSVSYAGTNAKMNEFSAAMGLCNLRHVDEEIAKRKRASERYFENLSHVAGLVLSEARQGVLPNYSYMPIVFEPELFGATRDDVFEALANEDIRARKYFYPLTSSLNCYTNQFNPDLTPIAKRIGDCVLSLPLFADLNSADIDRICAIVLGCR